MDHRCPRGCVGKSCGLFDTFGGLAAAQPVAHDLHYYDDYRTTNTRTEDLIAEHDGQCGSWAKFLLDALKTQGINQVGDYVIVTPLGDDGFIVDDWNFGAPSGADPIYRWENEVIGDATTNWNMLIDPPDSYAFLPGGDVTDQAGVAGQNKADPASMFANHQFVLLIVSGDAHLYDPSYGTEYSSYLDFDDNYLSGFFVMAPYDPATNRTTVQFRRNLIGTLEVSPSLYDY